MKGIYFEKYFLIILLTTFLLYFTVKSTLEALSDFASLCNINNDKVNNMQKAEVLIQLIVLLSVVLGGMFLALQNIVIRTYIAAAGFIWLLLVFIFVIADFIKYILGTHDTYNLTERNENIFLLSGLLMVFIYIVMYPFSNSDPLNSIIAKMPLWIKDFILMVFLICWYFSPLFFSITYIILTLNKLTEFFKDRDIKINNKKKKISMGLKVPRIHRIIKGLKNYSFFKGKYKGINYAVFFILTIIESLLMGIDLIIDIIAQMCLMIKTFCTFLMNIIIKSIHILRSDSGRIIAVLSRLSLIMSVLTVFVIDKYENVFSTAGSEIYEFLCSVLMIPFFITQLNKIRNKDNV